ncbi:MAG: M23 family metallopeptidase [Actinobacteria bacterium]|nr:M23 family metallopeptidase [Actinomycetota bacterium]NDG76971.1 M23 family metallopeptidase [Acidimicrobiia bacterium]NBO81164.1 M23 family metallopeptidase [Actinomycetota bacterium]NBP18096.1 M23 family metallopeptidase [Actinomycetota bacterium]NDC46006.1 M23 family metallopeptidase [Actinomycetota bacterium]
MIALVVAACLTLPANATVIEGFRAPACERCAGNRGIEYVVASSTVSAGAPGQVVFAGAVGGRNYVVVRHADDPRVRITYGRLASLAVQQGDEVQVGATLGHTMGELYVGVRVGQTYVNPQPQGSTSTPRFRTTLGAGRGSSGQLGGACGPRESR